MAPRTKKIEVGGETFEMLPWTIGQMEKMNDLLGALKPEQVGFAIFRMAMEQNATPKVEKADDLRPTMGEINNLVLAMNELSGIKVEPPVGEAKATIN